MRDSSDATSSNSTANPREPFRRAVFVTTHWSVVLSAKAQDSPQSAEALETLCRAYWYPLYAFVRRQGRSAPDAQDLTQEFFARLLEKNYLFAADREKGRFRTFLLMAFKRFLANEWDRSRRQKRGGGETHVPLDTSIAEKRYEGEPTVDCPADKIYERRWALTLLERAMEGLKAEFIRANRLEEFERLKACLTADRGALDYGRLAAQTGLKEGAVRVAVHRLRHRFRERFREEIAQTVSDPGEIEEEVRHLLAALSG